MIKPFLILFFILLFSFIYTTINFEVVEYSEYSPEEDLLGIYKHCEKDIGITYCEKNIKLYYLNQTI